MCFSTALFFKAMAMFALRMLADVVLGWLKHCRGSEGWGKGVPTCHPSRWHQQSATTALPPQLAAGTHSHLTQMERKTAFGPGERVSNQTQRKHSVSFQPLSRNWWILDHTNCILSGFIVQHCWKGFLYYCCDSGCAKCFAVRILPQVFYFCALLECTDWIYNITDKGQLWRMVFLNAEQIVDAVRCSNLCTSAVHPEQPITQFDVSLEAGRGHALSEE